MPIHVVGSCWFCLTEASFGWSMSWIWKGRMIWQQYREEETWKQWPGFISHAMSKIWSETDEWWRKLALRQIRYLQSHNEIRSNSDHRSIKQAVLMIKVDWMVQSSYKPSRKYSSCIHVTKMIKNLLHQDIEKTDWVPGLANFLTRHSI